MTDEIVPNPIRKIGFDLMTLVDVEAVLEEINELYYGADRPAVPLTLAEAGELVFRHLTPRPGALGQLRDLVAEGCVLLFFTDITEERVGMQAEEWLQTWTRNRDLVLHQVRNGQSPAVLDCQAYILAEGHGYSVPAGRPRVAEHPKAGPFDRKVVAGVRDVVTPAARKR